MRKWDIRQWQSTSYRKEKLHSKSYQNQNFSTGTEIYCKVWCTQVLHGITSHVSRCTGKHSHWFWNFLWKKGSMLLMKIHPSRTANCGVWLKIIHLRLSHREEKLTRECNCLWHRPWLLLPKHRPSMTTVLLYHCPFSQQRNFSPASCSYEV